MSSNIYPATGWTINVNKIRMRSKDKIERIDARLQKITDILMLMRAHMPPMQQDQSTLYPAPHQLLTPPPAKNEQINDA